MTPNISAKYFQEFFKGFPGTAEYGQEDANRFFTKDTIQQIEAEWSKFPKSFDNIPGVMKIHSGVGFAKEKDGVIIGYMANGRTMGYESNVSFDSKAGIADVIMVAKEEQTNEIAKDAKMERRSLLESYGYDRSAIVEKANKKGTLSDPGVAGSIKRECPNPNITKQELTGIIPRTLQEACSNLDKNEEQKNTKEEGKKQDVLEKYVNSDRGKGRGNE